jgi:predicted transglutaminase-like cysteine proteinase
MALRRSTITAAGFTGRLPMATEQERTNAAVPDICDDSWRAMSRRAVKLRSSEHIPRRPSMRDLRASTESIMTRFKNPLSIVLLCLALPIHAGDKPPQPGERPLQQQTRIRGGSSPIELKRASATESPAPMKQSSLDRINAQMNRVNALEIKAREDYYAYLVKKGDNSDSLEQFMDKYASLARFGVAATDLDIEQLQQLSGVKLPVSLVQFYRTSGSLDGGDHLHGLVVHSPESLVKRSAPDAPDWNRIGSVGLVDMIILSWGGDRPEFDPARSAGLTEKEVATLNASYTVIGWYAVEEGEGFNYLFLDAEGRFGTLFYHQDAFDELVSEHLKPMLQVSSADQSFDDAIAAFVEASAKPDALDEGEE